MTFSLSGKNSSLLLSVLLTSALPIVGCQPPAPTAKQPASENGTTTEPPLVIGADNVTMSADYILSIKPSRYQPSLGLQGNIEPIKQARFSTSQALTVQEVLVEEGQWVEKGTPLLIVLQTSDNETLSNKTVAPDNQSSNNSASNNDALVDEDRAVPIQPSDSQQEDESGNRVDVKANKLTSDKTTTIALNEPSLKNGNESNTVSTETAEQKNISANQQSAPIIVRAAFTGRIDSLYVEAMQRVDARKPLLHLSDDTDLRFIATLPLQAEPQLSVGQTVNFATESMTDKFTGQVSKLITGPKPNQLLVYVHVIKNEASRGKLKPNMAVTGRVNYGQIEVGTVVPKRAIHDADLSALKQIPHRPLMSLTATVWIIRQDQRLTRQPVEVIEYDPSTDQYLISGVNNDSLICLADLPLESAGKKVIIL